jgi:hypothetical protein
LKSTALITTDGVPDNNVSSATCKERLMTVGLTAQRKRAGSTVMAENAITRSALFTRFVAPPPASDPLFHGFVLRQTDLDQSRPMSTQSLSRQGVSGNSWKGFGNLAKTWLRSVKSF